VKSAQRRNGEKNSPLVKFADDCEYLDRFLEVALAGTSKER
jgi:hypothetical protein